MTDIADTTTENVVRSEERVRIESTLVTYNSMGNVCVYIIFRNFKF
jgi:hypothetical protein